eukprot:gene7957-10769_t
MVRNGRWSPLPALTGYFVARCLAARRRPVGLVKLRIGAVRAVTSPLQPSDRPIIFGEPDTAMTTMSDAIPETRSFEADVAKLLHLMVHSVYSDKDVFLRELVSNAADACEKLRYEALSAPELLGDDGAARITVTLDAEARRLTVEDNGIGMSEAELGEALGTIARSGTKAFMDRIAG